MPVGELDAGFSEPGATPTDWAQGRRQIDEAEVFWLSTVRPDGRPHVTPLLATSGHILRERPAKLNQIRLEAHYARRHRGRGTVNGRASAGPTTRS